MRNYATVYEIPEKKSKWKVCLDAKGFEMSNLNDIHEPLPTVRDCGKASYIL